MAGYKYFSLTSDEPITAAEAKEYQTHKGFIPAGYGFDDFEVKETLDLEGEKVFLATWKCSNSCE